MADLRDPIEFNEAYRRLAPRARAAARMVLHDEAAAEDVVQDVFMHLWRRPRTFDPDRGSLAGYVSMLARSRALDRWRSRVAHDSALGRSAEQRRAGEHSAEGADESVMRRERSRRLLGALDELPLDQRDALLLAYGRGLTAHEIAEVKHVPLGTAKSRLRLGLDKARSRLLAA